MTKKEHYNRKTVGRGFSYWGGVLLWNTPPSQKSVKKGAPGNQVFQFLHNNFSCQLARQLMELPENPKQHI